MTTPRGRLRKALDGVDRRTFLELSGAGVAALVLGAGPYTDASAARITFHDDPFSLGVASGDPLPDGVVIWTRLAPAPLDGGGMPQVAVPVVWEIARDEYFGQVEQRGVALARPELAHSVHAEVSGLGPGREYFYRFRVGGETSPVGRTKTAPAGRLSRVRFAFASCQQYEHGYYTAYRHMAEEDLDLILHLGDYIYEYGPDEYVAPGGNVRHHDSPEVMDLNAYRNRYALYRCDADLQAAHLAAPWIVTWDDHEVENNYADAISQDDIDPAVFLRRRAAAYQAYYEHMPLRRSSVPRGPDMRLYRGIHYGDLVDLAVLDTRQYRDDQASGDGIKPPSPEQADPGRSLTGDPQERWLIDRLTRSRALWKVIAQQVFFAKRDFRPRDGEAYSMDAWDGYPANRDRIMGAIAYRGIANPVVISGDVHANWASELKADFDDPGSPTLGVELVCTSITSGGDGSDARADTAATLGENPHIKFFNNYRGYVRCTATGDDLRADYRVLPYVQRPGAAIHTRASFQVEEGRPGLEKIAESPVPGGRPMSSEQEKTRIESQLD